MKKVAVAKSKVVSKAVSKRSAKPKNSKNIKSNESNNNKVNKVVWKWKAKQVVKGRRWSGSGAKVEEESSGMGIGGSLSLTSSNLWRLPKSPMLKPVGDGSCNADVVSKFSSKWSKKVQVKSPEVSDDSRSVDNFIQNKLKQDAWYEADPHSLNYGRYTMQQVIQGMKENDIKKNVGKRKAMEIEGEEEKKRSMSNEESNSSSVQLNENFTFGGESGFGLSSWLSAPAMKRQNNSVASNNPNSAKRRKVVVNSASSSSSSSSSAVQQQQPLSLPLGGASANANANADSSSSEGLDSDDMDVDVSPSCLETAWRGFKFESRKTPDPDDPSTWASRKVCQADVGVLARKQALKWVGWPMTKSGCLKKRVGRPTKEMVWERERLRQKIEQEDEDYNQRNMFLRCVYYNQSESRSRYRLAELLKDGVDLPAKWHLVGENKASNKKNKNLPYELKFSGHVSTVRKMDEVLERVLKEQVDEGNLIHFRVMDHFSLNPEEGNEQALYESYD